ncbi:MAG: SRPBCC family protein [Marmoricola sp.]
MTSPLVVQYSRAFPVPVEEAYGVVLPTPLEMIFNRRFGPIPPIRGVRGQDGVWGTVAQTRTIALADGGTMREELTRVQPPTEFGYTITGITGPMKPLVSYVEGRWAFEPAGTGTRITWQWTVHPASSVAALAMPLFGRLWRGYARQAMETIETLLLA